MLSLFDIKKLKPKDKEYTVADSPHLSLRIRTSGKRTWIFQKKKDGKLCKKTLGDFPDVGIKEARFLRDKLLAGELTNNNVTYETVFKKWMEIKRTQIKNYKSIELRFNKYILPFIGKKNVREITAPLVLDLLQIPAKEGHLETVRRLCGWIKQLETFSVNGGYVDHTRLQGLISQFKTPTVTHRPSVLPEQLPEVLEKLSKVSALTWQAILVGFYTLLRPGEYLSLKWDWIQDDYIEIPAEQMKMKKAHRVPMSAQLSALLNAIPRSSSYVFISKITGKPLTVEAIERAFRRVGLKGILVPHGIRSIGRSWMARNNIDYQVAEACLAHSVGSEVVQAYQRYDFLEERKIVMQNWCDYVEACRNSDIRVNL